jgi:hypothetical protein
MGMYRLIIEYSFVSVDSSFNNRVAHELSLIEPSPSELTGSFASFTSLTIEDQSSVQLAKSSIISPSRHSNLIIVLVGVIKPLLNRIQLQCFCKLRAILELQPNLKFDTAFISWTPLNSGYFFLLRWSWPSSSLPSKLTNSSWSS